MPLAIGQAMADQRFEFFNIMRRLGAEFGIMGEMPADGAGAIAFQCRDNAADEDAAIAFQITVPGGIFELESEQPGNVDR